MNRWKKWGMLKREADKYYRKYLEAPGNSRSLFIYRNAYTECVCLAKECIKKGK
jgi:hypothetical protein